MTTDAQANATNFEARPPVDATAQTPAEIEAEIEATRLRLAGTVDAIAERVKPANVARRAAESAKAQVLDGQGNLRTGRVAVLALAGAAVVGLLAWRRTR